MSFLEFLRPAAYSAVMEESTGNDQRNPKLERVDAEADVPGLSLSQLSSSFAKMFSRRDKPLAVVDIGPDERPTVAANGAPPVESNCPPADDPSADRPPAEACPVSPKSLLEAILFIGHPENEPLPAQQIASLMRGVESSELEQIVAELNADYREQGSAYQIESLAEGYRMVLLSELHGLRERFYGRIREVRLSRTAIDLLAIIAYSQPITRHEIDVLRGRPCGAVLTQLVRRQLLRIHRDAQRPRQVVYHTTDRFLRLFGLDSLEELPQSQMSLQEP